VIFNIFTIERKKSSLKICPPINQPTPNQKGATTTTTTTTIKGRNRRQGGQQQQQTATLEGSIPELGQNYYDCNSNRHADQFITTTRLLADYFVGSQKNAELFRNAILDQVHPTLPSVPRPPLNEAGTVDPFDMSDYSSHRDARDKKLEKIAELNMTLYSAVWRQCTLTMRARLKEDNAK
jgi:hypothetical protein